MQGPQLQLGVVQLTAAPSSEFAVLACFWWAVFWVFFFCGASRIDVEGGAWAGGDASASG